MEKDTKIWLFLECIKLETVIFLQKFSGLLKILRWRNVGKNHTFFDHFADSKKTP